MQIVGTGIKTTTTRRRLLTAHDVEELQRQVEKGPAATVKGRQRKAELDAWLERLRSGPLTSLEISTVCRKDDIKQLLEAAAESSKGQLAALDFKSNRLTSIDFFCTWLLSEPTLNLRKLNVSSNVISRVDAAILCNFFRSESANSLQYLDMSDCSLCVAGGDDSYLELLRAAVSLQSLRYLNMGYERRLTLEAFFSVAHVLKTEITQLRELSLEGLLILSDPMASHALGESLGSCSSIERISLASCSINDDSLESLVCGLYQSSRVDKFIALTLDYNVFSSATPINKLLGRKSRVNLVGLSLLGCRLTLSSQSTLAGRVACSNHLTSLNISANALSPVFMTVLTTRLRTEWKVTTQPSLKPPLRELNLSENSIGCRGVVQLFQLLKCYHNNHPIRSLQLCRSLPGLSGMQEIKSFLDIDKRLVNLELRADDVPPDFTLPLSNTSPPLFFVEWPIHLKIAFLSTLRRKSNAGIASYWLYNDNVDDIFRFLVIPVFRRIDMRK